MTPVLYAQEPTACRYASMIPFARLSGDMGDDWHAGLAAEFAARPEGHRPVRLPSPEADPVRIADNVRRLRAACDVRGVPPSLGVIDSEHEGHNDPRSVARVRMREGFLSVWARHFPGVPLCNVGHAGCSPEDADAVPDTNGNPGTFDAAEYAVQAPYCYGGAFGLFRRRAYATPFGLLAWNLSVLHAVYRDAERRDAPAPVLRPWLCPLAWSQLPEFYWRSLWWHTLLRCGPTALYFNAEVAGVQPDRQADGTLDELARRTDGGEWAGPLGLRLADRIATPASDGVASWAKLTDGSLVVHYTFGNNADRATLAVPGARRRVTVEREDCRPYAWGRFDA